MKQVHVDTGIESDIYEQEIEYKCADAIYNQQVGGKGMIAVQSNNKVLIYGGKRESRLYNSFQDKTEYDFRVTNTCKVYDFNLPIGSTEAWRDCSGTAPAARYSASYKQFGNKVIVFGGYSDYTKPSPTDGAVFDFNTEQWTYIPAPTIPASVDDDFKVFFAPDKVILIADSDSYEIHPLWGKIYDVNTNAWYDMSWNGGPTSILLDLEDPNDQAEGRNNRQQRYLWTGNKLLMFGGFETAVALTEKKYVSDSDFPALLPSKSVYAFDPTKNS